MGVGSEGEEECLQSTVLQYRSFQLVSEEPAQAIERSPTSLSPNPGLQDLLHQTVSGVIEDCSRQVNLVKKADTCPRKGKRGESGKYEGHTPARATLSRMAA